MSRINKTDLSRLILNLSNTIIQNRNNHLKKIDMTSSQADCLKYYIAHEGNTIRDYKDHAGITHQTARGLVIRLEEKGFLSVETSGKDRRCQEVSVTDKGKALSEILSRNGSRTAGLLVKGMSEAEQVIFLRLLNQAYQNVKNDGKEVEQDV